MLCLVGIDTCTIEKYIFGLLSRFSIGCIIPKIAFDAKISLVNKDTFATHLHHVNFLVRLILPSRI